MWTEIWGCRDIFGFLGFSRFFHGENGLEHDENGLGPLLFNFFTVFHGFFTVHFLWESNKKQFYIDSNRLELTIKIVLHD